MIRKLARKWRQYRYRFVPWLMMNLKDRSMRSVPSGHMDKIAPDEAVQATLIDFFTQLHHDTPVKIVKPAEKIPEVSVKDQSVKFSSSPSNGTALPVWHRNTVKINAANIADSWRAILNFLVHSSMPNATMKTDFHRNTWSLGNHSTTVDMCAARRTNVQHQPINVSSLDKRNIDGYSRNMTSYSHSVLHAGAKRGCFQDGVHYDVGHSYHTDIDKSMEEAFMKRMKQQAGCAHVAKRALRIMKGTLGFCIERCESVIPGGGKGVRVTKGVIPKHQVVAIYPGSVYEPWEAIFFQSLGNPFIFRCIDNVHIDGNDKGLSRFVYRSCGNRDRAGGSFTCDMSWLTAYPANPMAVGQYVNNQSSGYPANVAYQEFDVPLDFPFHLRQYLPNNFYSPSLQDTDSKRLLRTVVLVSLREIQESEELFSSYFTVVH